MDKPVRLSSDGVFYTLQGEGPRVGMPSLFVRFDTCNLRCRWGGTICDAFYTSWEPGDSRITTGQLTQAIKHLAATRPVADLVITGGEPTLQEHGVKTLTKICGEIGLFSTIETNGTRYIPESGVDLICISPKLKGSIPVGSKFEKMHEAARLNFDSFREWIDDPHSDFYYKFVIDAEKDIEEALYICAETETEVEPEHVVFMPQGIDRNELDQKGRWLAERCKDLGVRFTPRLQVSLWGNTPGT